MRSNPYGSFGRTQMILFYSFVALIASSVFYVLLFQRDFVMKNILDAFSDNLLKGATLMAFLYWIKDYVVEFGTFFWNVTIGTSLFKSLTITTADFDNKPIYNKVVFWLVRNYSFRISNTRIAVETKEYQWIIDGLPNNVELDFQPDSGLYLIQYQGKFVWINIDIHQLSHGTGFENKPQTVCTAIFKVFGWNSPILNQIIEESVNFYEKHKSPDKTTIRLANPWWPLGKFLIVRERVKNLNDIILTKSVQNRLKSILENFIQNPHIWKDHNLSHRESILLVGPPGNGKTMLINFIAGYLKYDILLVNLSSINVDDEDLLQIFGKAPANTVIVIEEIDAAGPQRDIKKEKSRNKYKEVTMSGLLLALDGPANKDGPVVVATTNRYEKLDNALKRPGRFNHHIKLDWSNEEQQKTLFKKYYPDVNEEDQDLLVENLKDKQISCASLVGMLRQGRLDETIKTPHEIALESLNLKSAKDVGGDRIDLDSLLGPFLHELEVRKEIVDLLLSEGLVTIRDFKTYVSTNNIIDFFSKPIFELETYEKVILTHAHKKLVDKATDQETKDKERVDKIKERLKKSLKKEKKKIKKLAKKKREEEKKKEEEKKEQEKKEQEKKRGI